MLRVLSKNRNIISRNASQSVCFLEPRSFLPHEDRIWTDPCCSGEVSILHASSRVAHKLCCASVCGWRQRLRRIFFRGRVCPGIRFTASTNISFCVFSPSRPRVSDTLPLLSDLLFHFAFWYQQNKNVTHVVVTELKYTRNVANTC